MRHRQQRDAAPSREAVNIALRCSTMSKRLVQTRQRRRRPDLTFSNVLHARPCQVGLQHAGMRSFFYRSPPRHLPGALCRLLGQANASSTRSVAGGAPMHWNLIASNYELTDEEFREIVSRRLSLEPEPQLEAIPHGDEGASPAPSDRAR
jgi:hypothetical protein